MRRYLKNPRPMVITGFLLPGMLVFGFASILPVLTSVYYSFFEWSGGPKMQNIGFGNYFELVADPTFWLSFKNNLLLVLFGLVGQIGGAFVLTAVLLSRLLKWKEFYRTVLFLPVILSAVVVGILWGVMYNYDYGLLNWIFRNIGWESMAKLWLDDPNLVIPSIAIVKVWQFLGYCLVILMAGAQGIPREIFEVAEIDGATGIRKTVHITLPLLLPTIRVLIMLAIAGNMKTFGHVYVLTGGGPGKSSMVLALYAYNTSLVRMNLGYGSSVSVGILVLSLGLIMLSRVMLRERKENI